MNSAESEKDEAGRFLFHGLAGREGSYPDCDEKGELLDHVLRCPAPPPPQASERIRIEVWSNSSRRMLLTFMTNAVSA
jgi:hypothetical protein